MGANIQIRLRTLLVLGLIIVMTNGCEKEPAIEDPDGNVYKIVTIGSQIWMTENLKTTRFSDNTTIPLVTDDNEWSSLTTPGYCYYDNAIINGVDYGILYNWYAVNTNKLCPAGWHVASNDEWVTLINFVHPGSAENALKEFGSAHWNNLNSTATDEYGFSARGGGCRSYLGFFDALKDAGYWWTSTVYQTDLSLAREIGYGGSIQVKNFSNRNGCSVRCIKDDIK